MGGASMSSADTAGGDAAQTPPAPPPPAPPPPAAGRRRGFRRARALVVLGSAALVIAIMATWIRAQIIDTDGWTQTSVKLLENEKVREFVANDLSERLLQVVDVQNIAADKLPQALAPLAPALATAAAQLVPQAIDRALEVPKVQELWGQANRLAHARVIKLLDGGSSELSTSGGAITLNLEALLDRLGARLGVGSEIGAKLPAEERRVVLFRSKQLRAAQNVIKGLRDLSFVLPALVVLLYAGALLLAAGSRRRVLLEIGIGIVVGALIALLLRRWVESYVVNTLVLNEGARPAIREVLSIATAGWRDRALWLLITGVLAIFAAWFAGPMRFAVKLRGFVARPLERHPAWFLGGAVALVLLIATLGPARTPGQLIPLLVELVLVVVGVLALRRQVTAERLEREVVT
jgi:hypothetical protein